MDTDSAPPYYAVTAENHAAWVVAASIIFLLYNIGAVATKITLRINLTSIKLPDICLIGSLVCPHLFHLCVLLLTFTRSFSWFKQLSSFALVIEASDSTQQLLTMHHLTNLPRSALTSSAHMELSTNVGSTFMLHLSSRYSYRQSRNYRYAF